MVKNNLADFATDMQALFDDEGLRLTQVTTWLENGARRWLGIARSGSWANRWWISPSYGHFRTKSQQLFDGEDKRLSYVTSYTEGSERRWVGISRSGNWMNRWFYRNDLDSFGLEGQRLFDNEGLRLIHVEVLE